MSRTNAHAAIDWEYRKRVILEVQAAGGTAADAAERLGISTRRAYDVSRQLGVLFPPQNAGTRAARLSPQRGKANAGQQQSHERMKNATANRFRAIRFAKAMEEAPPQPLSDAELVAQAIAEGRVTKIPAGSGLVPGWLFGITDNCVKPRAGASRGSQA